ncbi:hypothetical protein [Cohnella panacarvi]|uniref:hypothetical protein n=1 Tax=Cohnella panacarvi TaxID=400776 RepID=UPI00047DD531|nr:hypothetical protein [Cohnella panacarvi]
MRRNMFISIVMSIVLALGVLGQAVAANGIVYSRNKIASGGIIGQPLPGVKGGVPYMCSYSSPNQTFFTITCAQDINYSPYGFYAIDKRTFDLNIFEDKLTLRYLREDIDNLVSMYQNYLRELSLLLEELNRASLTWNELKYYARNADIVGSYAKLALINWQYLEGQIEYINNEIDFWVAP